MRSSWVISGDSGDAAGLCTAAVQILNLNLAFDYTAFCSASNDMFFILVE